jgi:enterochelin esterase-like enzyme
VPKRCITTRPYSVAVPESPPALGGPTVTDSDAVFWFADAGDDLAGVRLAQHAGVPGDRLDFTRTGDGWQLWLARPPVQRLEYRLELHHRDGRVEEICDPANPLRAPGAFGDKSVLEFPGYQAPAWLDQPGVPGGVQQLTVPSRLLGADIEVRLWSPDGTGATDPLPLLVAHDGPEYASLAGLLQFAAAQIAAGRLPAHRVALLAPGERDEWYSANVGYARALVLAVLPALHKAVRVRGKAAGMGASLGALAMMHAQRRHDTAFGGLFLQSGSFFDRRLDPQERGFARFTRVSRFVGDTLRHTLHPTPVPVTMTCGTAEENLANNRQYAAALAEERYPVRLVEVPDAHNYVAWRDAFDPALVDLLGTVWA